MLIDPSAIGAYYDTADDDDDDNPDSNVEPNSRIAVIDIKGPLEHHRGWWWDSYDSIVDRVANSLACEEVGALILRMDSPGGDVSGCFETVKTIQAMREECGKPIIAYVNEAAYSAAYALACAADEIYLPKSGGVGSIGVIATLCDRTALNKKLGLRVEVIKSGALKADGHPDVPLSDDVINRMQGRVNALAGQFFDLVSGSRGLSTKKIASFQAGTFLGNSAVKSGLADGVMSFADVVDSAQALIEETANGNQEPPKGDQAMKLIALTKKVREARASFNAAKSPAEREKTRHLLAKAERALAAAKGRVEGKTVKKEKYEKVEETDDDEDAEEADDEAADEDAEEADDDGDDDSGDDDEGDDDADADEDADEDAEEADDDGEDDGKTKKSKALALVREMTGTSNLSQAKGVFQAMKASHEKVSKLEAKVNKLDRDSRRARVEQMISTGLQSRKITPGQVEWARETGMKSPAQLRGFLKTAVPHEAVASEVSQGRLRDGSGAVTGPTNALGLSADEVKIATAMGVPLKDFAAQKATNGSGQSGLTH